MNFHAEPTPLHRAALTLHAMAANDRAWVLGALPESQRALLQPLLMELDALGVPKEQALIADLPEAAAVEAHGRPWLLNLDGEGVAALAVVLAGQPVQLTQALLAMHAWSWRAQLLETFGEEQRRAALVTVDKPPPRLQTVILQALRAKWQAAQAQRRVPAPGLWARTRARLARLGRVA